MKIYIVLVIMLMSFVMGLNSNAEMLPENITFVYSATSNYNGDYMYVEYDMKFDGTLELEGEIWQQLKQVRCIGIIYPSRERVTGETGFTYLIRKDNGKYYIHKPVEEIKQDSMAWWDKDVNEAPTYDYNCNTGEYFDMYNYTGEIEPAYVIDTKDFVDGKGVTRKVLHVDPHYYLFGEEWGESMILIEDLGPINGYGFLAIPYIDFYTGMSSSPEKNQTSSDSGMGEWPRYTGRKTYLEKVIEDDGTIIYERGMYDSVQDIVSDSTDENPKFYDLIGHEVQKPRSGGIYIKRTGSKIIKVIM